jgi:hypothetical protein
MHLRGGLLPVPEQFVGVTAQAFVLSKEVLAMTHNVPRIRLVVTGMFLAASTIITSSTIHAVPIAMGTYDLGTDPGKFDPTAAGSGFTITSGESGSTSVMNANEHVFSTTLNSNQSASKFSYAQFQFNPAVDPGFEYSATVRITAPTTGNNFQRIELMAMGNAAPTVGNPTTASNALFLNYRQSENALILSNGAASGSTTGGTVLASAVNATPFNYSNPFTLTYSGIFSGNDLIINAQATQGSNVVSIPPYTLVNFTNTFGNYFGYGGRASFNGTLRFDEIAVNIIPEPGSLALLAAGGLLMLPRRKRAVR